MCARPRRRPPAPHRRASARARARAGGRSAARPRRRGARPRTAPTTSAGTFGRDDRDAVAGGADQPAQLRAAPGESTRLAQRGVGRARVPRHGPGRARVGRACRVGPCLGRSARRRAHAASRPQHERAVEAAEAAGVHEHGAELGLLRRAGDEVEVAALGRLVEVDRRRDARRRASRAAPRPRPAARRRRTAGRPSSSAPSRARSRALAEDLLDRRGLERGRPPGRRRRRRRPTSMSSGPTPASLERHRASRARAGAPSRRGLAAVVARRWSRRSRRSPP